MGNLYLFVDPLLLSSIEEDAVRTDTRHPGRERGGNGEVER
jgi:hypothetical protein